MKKEEFAHESKGLIDMYGHLLRKIKNYSGELPELNSVHEIGMSHREKMLYLLDKVYNSLGEDKDE